MSLCAYRLLNLVDNSPNVLIQWWNSDLGQGPFSDLEGRQVIRRLDEFVIKQTGLDRNSQLPCQSPVAVDQLA